MNYQSFFIFLFVLFCCCQSFCQSKSNIGITAGIEQTVASTLHPEYSTNTKATLAKANAVFAVSYERLVNQRMSFEVGLKYRQADVDISFPIILGFTTVLARYSVTETFISLPLLCKYRTRIVNVSAGVSFDYFTGEKQTADASYKAPLPYKTYLRHKLSAGLLATVSKSFSINKRLFIEPSLYYNPMLSFKRSYYGVAMAVKYGL